MRKLSVRQLEVLHLLVKGYTSQEMADELGIGLRTIETHRAVLKKKLGLKSRKEIIEYANSKV